MKLFSAGDLCGLPSLPSQWVVEGLLRYNRKRPSLLCGSPHSGKSTLARQLSVAVAQGIPFLDRNTLKGKVIYWQSEEIAEDAAEDFRAAGMRPEDEIVILHPDPADHHILELRKALDTHADAKLCVIETLDDMLKMPDLNDNPDCRVAFEQFDEHVLSAHCGHCAFLILHHTKKSDSQKGLSINKIMGGTVISGRTDAKMFVRQVSDSDTRRIFHAQIRKGLSIEPSYLIFDSERQTSELGGLVAEKKTALQELGDATLSSKISATLEEHPGKPKWETVKLVGGNSKAVGQRIDEMIVSGEITEIPGGKKGNAKLLYLTGQEPTTVEEKQCA